MSKTLPSLFPEVVPEYVTAEVPLADIEVSDFVDPTPEFVESIRRFGVLQPVLLCKRGDKYHVLAGRRRVLASRIVGLTVVKAVVIEGLVYGDVSSSVLTLEAQRHYNENPVAEYMAIRTLVTEGYSSDQIKEALGIPIHKIEKLLSLANLPQEVLDGVSEKKVAVSTAQTLAKMAPTYQKKAVAKFKKDGTLTGSDLVQIKRARKSETSQAVMVDISASVNVKKYPADLVADCKMEWDESNPYDLSRDYVQGWNDAISAAVLALKSAK
jgi:ParB/RepB/Spo0J family partition protein